MKKICLCFIILITSADIGISQRWIQQDNIPNDARWGAIGCSCAGKGYVGLGVIEDGTYLSDFWEFDSTLNHWTRKADFPAGGRNAASAYSVKGKIYVCFGFDTSNNSNNDIWEYDPFSNTWTQKAVFPGHPRFSARGFVISDSLLYIGTGTYNSGADYLYDFWMYNPSNDTWIRKSDFPGNKRMGAISFEINDTGYLGGGLSDPYTIKKDFWKYDPLMDSWSNISNFPDSATFCQVSFVLKNEGYVGTGYDLANFYISFYRYNPQNNFWTQIVSPPAYVRANGIGFTLGKKGYIGAGWDNANCFADFWSFSPDSLLSINNTYSNENVNIYPNPAVNKIHISLQYDFGVQQKSCISVSSIQGQILIQQQLKKETEIDISGLTNGIYLVKIYNENLTIIKKLIKD
jgi:N-acetylneuraminic acid mutarotase